MAAIRTAAQQILADREAGRPVDPHAERWARWVLWHAPLVWPHPAAGECFTEIVL